MVKQLFHALNIIKKEGNHTIYFNIQKDKTFSMDSMFKNINNLISIILSLY